MNLALLMYAEMEILCIMLILYIAYKSFRSVENRETWRYYKLALCVIEVVIGADLIWAFMEGGVIPSNPVLSFTVNAAYFIVGMAVTDAWFLFTETELDCKAAREWWFHAIISIPLFITIVLVLLSYKYGIIFRIDEHGCYERGPLSVLMIIFPCIYLLISVIHALVCALKKENYLNRRKYLSLAGFAVLSSAGCIVQHFVPGTPVTCVGISFAALMVYINQRDSMVSLDPLTKLNNRSQMERHLTNKMEHRADGKKLYLLIIDMDKFKGINDNYGHVEGDYALMELADVLRAAAAKFNCFISRYGGDEFIVIHETESDEELHDLCEFIHTSLNTRNAATDKPYSLHTSIGVAQLKRDINYVPDFIAEADRALYEIKNAKKRQRMSA